MLKAITHLPAADAPLLGVLRVQGGVRAVNARRDLIGDDEPSDFSLHLRHLNGKSDDKSQLPTYRARPRDAVAGCATAGLPKSIWKRAEKNDESNA